MASSGTGFKRKIDSDSENVEDCGVLVFGVLGQGVGGYNINGGDQQQDRSKQPKTYYCLYESCGRTFSKKSNLVAHEKAVHYEIKPYPCDLESSDGKLCGRSFGFKHVLNKHIQTVHHEGKRPRVCKNPYMPSGSYKKTLKNEEDLGTGSSSSSGAGGEGRGHDQGQGDDMFGSNVGDDMGGIGVLINVGDSDRVELSQSFAMVPFAFPLQSLQPPPATQSSAINNSSSSSSSSASVIDSLLPDPVPIP